MHNQTSSKIPHTGRFRLASALLLSVAAGLTAFAQATSSPPATTTQTTTTTETTTTPAPSTTSSTTSENPVILSEFTVNGSYASSLEMAAQEKQASPAIVEVIAPEDIGVLPDVSIADDLVRLTGVTSQRVNGRNQEITIRGLDPDFNVGLLDGVEQATTGDN